jgi:hypothetical protein
MPPTRSLKYRERLTLVRLIDSVGFEMPPCSYCERNERKCIVSGENSNRCSECVRRGEKCDVEGPSSSDLLSIIREQERLSRERKETLAKLIRLDRQQEFLSKRAGLMVRRGLKTMDELDEVEEKEKQEKENERAATEGAAMLSNKTPVPLATSDLDPFAGLDVPLLPPGVWADWDFGDEIPQSSQGN